MVKTAAKGAYTQRPIRRPVGAFRSPFSVLRSPERHRRSSRGGGDLWYNTLLTTYDLP